ncbi:MAG: acyl carrier protein [Deltaproteobacteria bacterium]
MAFEDTQSEVHEIVARTIDRDPKQLQPEDNLTEQHDVDSLMGLEILVALEKRYQIQIPESMLQEMTSIARIASTVWERLESRQQATA